MMYDLVVWKIFGFQSLAICVAKKVKDLDIELVLDSILGKKEGNLQLYAPANGPT